MNTGCEDGKDVDGVGVDEYSKAVHTQEVEAAAQG